MFTALTRDINPPSNVERIDPKTLHLSGEFAEHNLGTTVGADGSVTVRVIATQFMFVPRCIAVPRGRAVTLRFASPDVIHGLLITGTNVNTMVVPGFVAQVHTEFTRTGDLLMPCHEYCGLGHSEMWATVQVHAGRSIQAGPGREGFLCATLSGFALRISGWRSRRFCVACVLGTWQMWVRSPLGRQCRHAGAVFHVGDGARRLDGLCADHLLHHGLRLFRCRDGARPSAARQSLGVGRVLDGDRRRRDGAGPDR